MNKHLRIDFCTFCRWWWHVVGSVGTDVDEGVEVKRGQTMRAVRFAHVLLDRMCAYRSMCDFSGKAMFKITTVSGPSY